MYVFKLLLRVLFIHMDCFGLVGFFLYFKIMAPDCGVPRGKRQDRVYLFIEIVICFYLYQYKVMAARLNGSTWHFSAANY